MTSPGMWKRLFRLLLPLPPTKNEKTTVDYFLLLWICSLPSPTLHHFKGDKSLCIYSRFRLIGPPVNRASRLIGPNCEERNPIKDNALRYIRIIGPQL